MQPFFRQRRPAPPLDRFVDAVWVCRNAPSPRRLERVLPSGTPQLIVNLMEDQTRIYRPVPGGLACDASPGSVIGLATRHQIIDTDEQSYVAGVVFHPGGTLPFAALPAEALRDADVPLDTIWGSGAVARLRARLIEAATPDAALDVLEQTLLGVWRDRTPHPAVAFALAEFRARPLVTRIAAVTGAVGLSSRCFTQRFKAEVGVSPKRYCRLLRFQRMLAAARAPGTFNWGDLALACGYYDQAHFIHEFRAFSGLTPTAYAALRTRFQNHVTFLQDGRERSSPHLVHG